MTGTILTDKSRTVDLDSYRTGNPFTIDAGTKILTSAGDAIYGDATKAWTLTNSGTLDGNVDGIDFAAGGLVTNGAGATIEGGSRGIFMNGAYGNVTNAGLIQGTAYMGIELEAGGRVYNETGGSIRSQGSVGVLILGAAGTVTNQGVISSASNVGVALDGGGTITNVNDGSITGKTCGTFCWIAEATVINDGRIRATAATGVGISLRDGGAATNAAGALVMAPLDGILVGGQDGTIINAGTIDATGTHGIGVDFANAGPNTLTNGGTIIGTSGEAVQFGTGNDRLIIDPGAIFRGAVNGGGGSNTIELAAGKVVGVLSGLGRVNFANFQTVVEDAKADWHLTGTNQLGAGTSLTNAGTLAVSGTTSLAGSVTGTGTIVIDAGAAIVSAGILAATQSLEFYATTGALKIQNVAGFKAGVEGFGAGDHLDIANPNFAYNATETFGFVENAAGTKGVLTIVDGTHQMSLTLFGQYVAGDFRLQSDGAGGTLVTFATPAARSPTLLAGH
jgi:hypothetical protein